MRRAASILFLFVGGFCVGMQVMVAFIAGGGIADYLGRVAYFTAIAIPFLALGTWLSPGRRWRELGLAMLIGAAVCAGSFSVAIFLPDEHGVVMDRAQLTPYLALGAGFANLGLVVAAGLMLYLRGGGGEPSRLAGLVRTAVGEIRIFVQTSLPRPRRK